MAIKTPIIDLLKRDWMAVELAMKVPDNLRPRGGMSQTAVWKRTPL